MRKLRYTDAILREHERTQMELLRENGYSNRKIAEILHTSPSRIYDSIGPQPPEMTAASGKSELKVANARKIGAAHIRPTDEERKRRLHERKLRQQESYKKDPNDAIIKSFVEQLTWEPHGSSSVVSLIAASDLLASIRCEHERLDVRLTSDGVSWRPIDSDDYPWVDEPEPEIPHVPSGQWYRRYSTWWRNEQRLIDEAKARGMHPRITSHQAMNRLRRLMDATDYADAVDRESRID
jgi:hypothetical protein